MVSEEVEKKLYEAALKGDVTTLVRLVEEDPYLVHGVSFPCSRNLLHVAAARGHAQIALELFSKDPEMCWRRDDQGMNPVHVAAMNGCVQILEHLLKDSCFPALERLHHGQTVLHLCVKHAQLDALKFLVEKLGDLVCTKDDDGDTLLHLAVRCNQLQIVDYLVGIEVLKQETRNGMGKTAVQILNESLPTTPNYSDMKKLLKYQSDLFIFQVIPEMSNTMMVVAVLIATMAFQSAISPAGGVWGEDDHNSSHMAGKAVMASTHPHTYMTIRRANTTAFLCSLAAMYLFTFRVQLENYTFAFALVSFLAMGAALVAVMVTFLTSTDAVTPYQLSSPTGNKIMWGLLIFALVWACGVYVKHVYRSWRNKKNRQLNLRDDAFHRRVFYWIFDKMEKLEFSDGSRWGRVTPPTADPGGVTNPSRVPPERFFHRPFDPTTSVPPTIFHVERAEEAE
ncbi:ankyrin repeat-containing protein NPR4-like [Salvia hispanica]|uniref:ankyrin repeat-containing protein NPR4-like n=1 Tax=Salvia hispanica TaxID=49212 RepID=UPI002009773A|nr:ankyrin repeat-containing protein NPR4-like [Salvia hispanica]